MFRYYKKKGAEQSDSVNSSASRSTTEKSPLPASRSENNLQPQLFDKIPQLAVVENIQERPEMTVENMNLLDLASDPGKRIKITDFHPNVSERVRRKYYTDGACQPKLDKFPQSDFKGTLRRFSSSWFKEYLWLEYSISKDAAFCLYCYLFRNELGHQGGGDTFVSEGFRDWKNKDKLCKHEGGPNSAHNQAFSKCKDLLNQKQHIETIIVKMTDKAKLNYRVRLNASIDCIRWLLKQGLAFRGHDESEGSSNQGNFRELLKFLVDHNEDVRKVALDNAPSNLKLVATHIQKDIIRACAFETTRVIIAELGDNFFSVLLDDVRDVSTKEQMAVVLRFVDRKGRVLEWILGFRHVECTTALSLKCELEDLLNSHGLSISMMRGQGYDGASNMQGEFNGLKSLILKENETAYYVHCFAHQLQLALVAVAKNHIRVCELFLLVSNIVNVVAGSCKRKDKLRENQAARILQGLQNGEIDSGQGLNQEKYIHRPCDTRWGLHYGTLLSLIDLFDSTVDVLRVIVKEGTLSNQRGEASRLIKEMRSFDFIFDLHLMKFILGITNDLSQALQRKDQDIVNAIALVNSSKERLQKTRDVGWSSLLEEVSLFCVNHNIEVPDMDDIYVGGKRPKRNAEEIKNSHRYRVQLFNTVVDMQLTELNGRFNEVNTELLLCVACLNPTKSFAAFDKEKLIRLEKFYPNDFQGVELLALSGQLENFVTDIRKSSDFVGSKGLGCITEQMVETGRDLVYPLVYKLITLALVLSVATATVKRAFSAMKIVKNRLRNWMSDDLMNDALVVYIEKDIFNCVSNEAIINKFQSMGSRRGQL